MTKKIYSNGINIGSVSGCPPPAKKMGRVLEHVRECMDSEGTGIYKDEVHEQVQVETSAVTTF